MKRNLSLDEIRELLQMGIARKKSFIEENKGGDNPQIRDLVFHARGTVDGLEAALSALNGDNFLVKLIAGK